jgi:RNA polymerase sigma-70 factor (ECF subfamily)
MDELAFMEPARERLRSALQQLPARARRAFLLHRLEGLSHAEVAERLGVPVSVVGQDVREALAHLKRAVLAGGPWKSTT